MSFPGLFTPEGLLGAGPQTTAWLYMFWHAGFPLCVIVYAVVPESSGISANRRPRTEALAGVALVLLTVIGCVLLATRGHDLLPAVMQGNHYNSSMIGVISCVWLFSLGVLLVLWLRRPHTVLDLWLMIVMCAWVFDIALSAVFNAGRFDMGFYTGRIFGLLAATLVLAMLLLENARLYAQLVQTHEREHGQTLSAQALSLQLTTVNALLSARNEQLEKSSRLKSEFLSGMSHELRTPLNAIIGFSEMMKDGLTGDLMPIQATYLGHIFLSGQHLLAMINDILDLSKIEAGKAEMTLDRVDLEALLSDSLAVIAARAEAKQISLQRDTQIAIGLVQADHRRLRQIIDNLLSNALKFTPVGGEIRLRAALVDRAQATTGLPGFLHGMRLALPDNEFETFVEISVTDTGIGLQPDDAARLFTPFTQISNVLTRQGEGTGLGLAMVRGLAELHGGTVAVSSERGRGSCFTVWLPWRSEALPFLTN